MPLKISGSSTTQARSTYTKTQCAMSIDKQKLMEFDKVNEERATRLLKEFGSYESVMNATYEQLLETHYIGQETAKSIHFKSKELHTATLVD